MKIWGWLAPVHQPISARSICLDPLLDDLAYKHQEMVRVWEDFALANIGLANLTLPPSYQIGENTRNLLAFAIRIALKHPPLRALQLQIPQPLLQPDYAKKHRRSITRLSMIFRGEKARLVATLPLVTNCSYYPYYVGFDIRDFHKLTLSQFQYPYALSNVGG